MKTKHIHAIALLILATLALVSTSAQTTVAPSTQVILSQTATLPAQAQVNSGNVGLFIRDLTGLSAPLFYLDAGQVNQSGPHVTQWQGRNGKRFDGGIVNLAPGTYVVWESTHPSVYSTIVALAH